MSDTREDFRAATEAMRDAERRENKDVLDIVAWATVEVPDGLSLVGYEINGVTYDLDGKFLEIRAEEV